MPIWSMMDKAYLYSSILHTEMIMNDFFPFIHKNEKKKKEDELQPLYIELYPPPPEKKEKEDDDQKVIIIQL
jgi:hypothetical protein